MSLFQEVLTAIGAIGALAGLGTLMWKTGVWAVTKSPEQKDQNIDQQEQQNEQQAEQTGRPV